jgi:hypothetical protein
VQNLLLNEDLFVWPSRHKADVLLQQLVLSPLSEAKNLPERRFCVVVDSLDEGSLEGTDEIPRLLAKLAKQVGGVPGFRVLASSRPQVDPAIWSEVKTADIDLNDSKLLYQHRLDIRRYVVSRLDRKWIRNAAAASDASPGSSAARAFEHIVYDVCASANDNFLMAELVCDGVLAGESSNELPLVSGAPAKLGGLYHAGLSRVFGKRLTTSAKLLLEV